MYKSRKKDQGYSLTGGLNSIESGNEDGDGGGGAQGTQELPGTDDKES